MSKDTCRKLFSFLVIDHKAAQGLLNDMAAQGWELVDVPFGLVARFRRTDRRDLSYFLDWNDPKYLEENDYLQLCADAGWEPVYTLDYRNIYVSRPGTRPDPIQTDPALEYQRFRKKALRRMVFGFALCAALLVLDLMLWGFGGANIAYFLRASLSGSIVLTVSLFFAPFWLAGGLAYLIELARRLHLWRQAAWSGGGLPSAPRAARIWSLIRLGGYLSLDLILVLFLLDALYNGLGSLGTGIGFLIGSFIGAWMYHDNPRLYRRALLSAAWAAGFLLCLWLNGPLRPWLPSRTPTPPVLEGTLLDIGSDRADALLGSQARWEEYLPGPDPDFPRYPSAGTMGFSTVIWATPALAQRFLDPLPPDMAPVEGLDGFWVSTDNRADFHRYTLRWKTGELTMTCYGEFPSDWTDPDIRAMLWERLQLEE